MRGTDAVLIVLTFLTGVFAGVYLYITVFAPDYGSKESGVEDTSAISFQLQGEAFGGCRMTGGDCGSFTLKENRSYTYRAGGTDETKTGYVSRITLGAVMDAVEEGQTSLERFMLPGTTSCVSAADGIDYRYRLIYDGETYDFSTCGTRFTDSALAAAFVELWGTFDASAGPADNLLDVDVPGLIEEKIDSLFKYDDQ